MRKDRNSFFSETNMMQPGFAPNGMMQNPNLMQQPMMQNPAPYQTTTATNSFYTGPNPNMMMNPQNNMPVNNYVPNNNELESRLAKMERQIRRLETRVNKLESHYTGSTFHMSEEIDSTNASNMYMI